MSSSSSSSYFLVVSFAVLLQFLLVSSASTKYIDAVCQRVTDKAFCVRTLKEYPLAASATSTFQAAKAVIRLGVSYAEKSASFTAKATKENPKLKNQFTACQNAYNTIIMSLKSAASELKESPETSNYDVMVCSDSTTKVKNLVGKNRDEASKIVMKNTLQLEKLLGIAVGATLAVGG